MENSNEVFLKLTNHGIGFRVVNFIIENKLQKCEGDDVISWSANCYEQIGEMVSRLTQEMDQGRLLRQVYAYSKSVAEDIRLSPDVRDSCRHIVDYLQGALDANKGATDAKP